MKLYIPPPPDAVIRVWIKKKGCDSQYLTLSDCSGRIRAAEWVQDLLRMDGRITPFATGYVTNVQLRDAVGSVNGLSTSISFRGLDPLEVKELIIKNLTE